jgi:hypothetical protein
MPGYLRRMGRPLEIAACRSACAWDATGECLGGEPLFCCAGCGSEWVPSEPWTPIDWTGQVPDPVQRAVRERRGRG